MRSFGADGASKERRALLRAVQELFPNVVIIFRDAAHALRIACLGPVHLDELFGEVWGQLCNKRRAMVPDIMNSTKWQDLFQHIQKEVLRIPCVDRPLAVVIKHMRFAKQRCDNVADLVANDRHVVFVYRFRPTSQKGGPRTCEDLVEET